MVSATDASTAMSFSVVLFCGSVEAPPSSGGVFATLSRRARGSLPATDTESMSLRSSATTLSAPASTWRLSPRMALTSEVIVETAAEAPTPTDLPPLLPLPFLFLIAMPFLSAEALAVVYTFCAPCARSVIVSSTTMSAPDGRTVFPEIVALVLPLITATAAAPATPTFAAPTPEIADVEIRLPTPSSSPGLPKRAFMAATTMSRTASIVMPPVIPYLSNRASSFALALPVSRPSRNSGSDSVLTKSSTMLSAKASMTALVVSSVSLPNCTDSIFRTRSLNAFLSSGSSLLYSSANSGSFSNISSSELQPFASRSASTSTSSPCVSAKYCIRPSKISSTVFFFPASRMSAVTVSDFARMVCAPMYALLL